MIDPKEIEKLDQRWHGHDHRIVVVRWEPYKPDVRRQMKRNGRWQEMVTNVDFHRWQNCNRPDRLMIAGEVDAVKAENNRLRAALQPFADRLDVVEDTKGAAKYAVATTIEIEHLRNAKKAIEGDQ